ncbi:MAG TPA: Gfo/Idh/MocA family oxidoreductase [Phycisphaerae bacterium]|nr:Gfo/Idh/MocA family oxidoreductase [Phycisphaerae bacterium]HOM53580.1 Gfo/Idh/MocA family oxidoreductase [Phycisphaerae bacterium]HPU25938.1 Gfo/Idh/MocA family oxidoreductase [Phycisphaerae bacterium]
MESTSLENQNPTRRRFLEQIGAATFAGTLAGITIVPRHVLGGPRHIAPSEKLNIAGIGVGGQGFRDLENLKDQNIVALCDVDDVRAAEAYRTWPDARRYKDYREMLDAEGDKIDAVVVATPDHVHAVASMAAIRRGKHVYCEKPLTRTIGEARALAEAARKAGVATQMGNSGQATEDVRVLCEMIWSGAIGPVREVHIWSDRPMNGLFGTYWPQGVDRPKDTPPVPSTLAWDLWLGPAPERPYHPAYVPFKWRGWWDYGTGALGDMGCHSFDPAFRALKLGYPTSVEAVSTSVNKETFPLASRVRYEFPAREDMPAVSLTWYDGGMRPPRPRELEDGRELGEGQNGLLFIGDHGTIMTSVAGRKPRLVPESRMRSYKLPPKTLPRSIGHFKEWVEACKGGQPTGSNFDFASRVTETVLLGCLALRPELREAMNRQRLEWDGAKLAVTNLPEANAFIHTTYREGWELEKA